MFVSVLCKVINMVGQPFVRLPSWIPKQISIVG
jgi:hypothetical protein